MIGKVISGKAIEAERLLSIAPIATRLWKREVLEPSIFGLVSNCSERQLQDRFVWDNETFGVAGYVAIEKLGSEFAYLREHCQYCMKAIAVQLSGKRSPSTHRTEHHALERSQTSSKSRLAAPVLRLLCGTVHAITARAAYRAAVPGQARPHENPLFRMLLFCGRADRVLACRWPLEQRFTVPLDVSIPTGSERSQEFSKSLLPKPPKP